MKQSTLQSFMDVGLQAVEAATPEIMRYFQSGKHAISIKPDSSPVTEADRVVEKNIKEVILNTFPSHAFFGEESGKSNFSDSNEFVWVIDPIDGTRMFIKGIPGFSTELALLHHGQVILGISHVPTMHRTITAMRGCGAFLDGVPLKVSSVDKIENSFIAVSSLKNFIRSRYYPAHQYLHTHAFSMRSLLETDAHYYCATGKVDALISLGGKSWDYAAMTCILTEAGARCTTIDGNDHDFLSSEKTSFLVANQHLHSLLTSIFAEKGQLE